MGLFDRFFGGGDARPGPGEQLIANPDCHGKLSLQILFSYPTLLETENLKGWLRAYDAELSRAECEIDPATAAQGTPAGLIGWGNHVIQLVGFTVPMPSDAVERCVQGAHYKQELKAEARAHQAHVILYYAGYETSVLEQYVALAAVAGAMGPLGAITVLNESACTSMPIGVFSTEACKGAPVNGLRHFSILYLFCGFVKYELPDSSGVWMRTHGSHLLGFPDLAMLRSSHAEGETTFQVFSDVYAYLLNTGARLKPGETMQVGRNLWLKLRPPNDQETFLESPGELLIAEMISKGHINR